MQSKNAMSLQNSSVPLDSLKFLLLGLIQDCSGADEKALKAHLMQPFSKFRRHLCQSSCAFEVSKQCPTNHHIVDSIFCFLFDIAVTFSSSFGCALIFDQVKFLDFRRKVGCRCDQSQQSFWQKVLAQIGFSFEVEHFQCLLDVVC